MPLIAVQTHLKQIQRSLNELKNTVFGIIKHNGFLKEVSGKQNTDTFKDIESQFKATQKKQRN